jgi:molecular chaperone DnaK (HSP70)
MNGSIGIAIGTDSVTATVIGAQQAAVSAPAQLALTPTGARLIYSEAQRSAWAATAPVYRNFLGRIGDPVPVIGTNGEARLGADLVATTIATILGRGDQPPWITIARPARWSAYQSGALRAALDRSELRDWPISLLSAPIAALASADLGGAETETVIVADIDASATEVSLVTSRPAHAKRVLETITMDSLSINAIDDRLACHLLAQLPEPTDRAARRELLTRCGIAREELAGQTATTVQVRLASRYEVVRIVRAEFDSLITGPIDGAAATIARMISRAHAHGLTVDAIVLVGPGARIPLLSEMLSTTTRVQLIVPPGPATAIARGAAQLAARHEPAVPIPRHAGTPTSHPPIREASRHIGSLTPQPAAR